MAAKYDLTNKAKQLYNAEDILEAKLALLEKTNVIDSYIDVYKMKMGNSEEVPSELLERRNQVLSKLHELENQVHTIINFLDTEENLNLFKSDRDWNLSILKEKCEDFKPELLDIYYQYAQFQYNCGDYYNSAVSLVRYRIMSTNFKKSFSALWGKFATEILTENWKSAHEDLLRIRETLEKKATEFTSVELLNQRSWLIHWSLFVFFNYEKTPEGLVDLLFQSHYLNAIQTACPHILRYLCAAVVLSKRKRHLIGELTRVLEEERGNYDDPLTQFVHYLFVCYDFDEAQKTLRDCETVLRNDFFLYSFQEDFVENARLFIFENYCKVNPRISIKMLAEKLNFDEEKAEVWVVDLICNARLDAKIDCEEGFVIMGSQGTSVYQEVIEKTSRLSNRSHEIVNILTKRITASQKNAIYPLDA